VAERKASGKAAAEKGDEGRTSPSASTAEESTPKKAAAAPAEEPTSTASNEAVTTQAAPLDAPEKKVVLGNPESSTNYVAANAALRSPPGANHIRLLTEDGRELGPEDVFEFPPPESPSMLATVKQRVIQEFTYPGALTPTRHLMYPAGAQVPVGQALQLRDAMRVVTQ
jgi:hypothetical protein